MHQPLDERIYLERFFLTNSTCALTVNLVITGYNSTPSAKQKSHGVYKPASDRIDKRMQSHSLQTAKHERAAARHRHGVRFRSAHRRFSDAMGWCLR